MPHSPVPGDDSSARHGQARLAGLAYAVVVATGTFSLGFAPERIFIGDTAAALAASVTAQDALLRASVLAEAVCYIAFAGLALALYWLFRPVNAAWAAMLAVVVLVSVAFGFANLTHLVDIQRIVEDGNAQAPAEAIEAAFARYRAGLFLQSAPWGLWLLPFGLLVIRSGFLPWILGVLLLAAGAGYLCHFVGRLLVIGYADSIWPKVFAAPRIGEILICLWLLCFGARATPWPSKLSLHQSKGD